MEGRIKGKHLAQTFNLLKYTFGIVPIVAGADKFTNILTNWGQYLSPTIEENLPISSSLLIAIVGVIEIVAGIIVFKRPVIGGYIVASWLTLVTLTLLIGFNYLDVAVRDLVMAICALVLARMARSYE